MQCKYPITPKSSGGVPVPCGQCLPCRINDRRVKTHRMMLEASCHEHNSFLTLTYNDGNIPQEYAHEKTGQLYYDDTLNPAHLKAFLNNLQVTYKSKLGIKIRYFACGEYGDKTSRPHYHVALFGYPPCSTPDRLSVISGNYIPCECHNCKFLSNMWGKGNIFLGSLEQYSAQYIAGYVTKKLTASHPHIGNRYPEFSRMSLKPALGRDAIIKQANRMRKYFKTADDVPKCLIHDGKKWPIGRYLYETYLQTLGFNPEQISKAARSRKKHDQVLAMFKDKTLTSYQKTLIQNGLPDACLHLLNAQKTLNLEKKFFHKTINKKIRKDT